MKQILSTLAVALLFFSSHAFAAGAEYTIRAVHPAIVPSPDVSFNGTQHRSGRAESWLEVEVDFESTVDWTDELTFKYYCLINGKCVTGEVTHVSIPKGRDLHSVMYIPPRSLMRVMEGKALSGAAIENVAVQILKQGAVVDTKSFKPAPNPEWFSK